MFYRVIPFIANIGNQETVAVAAAQLEGLIAQMAASGFEYVRLESVETYVQGTAGCFGIGAREPMMRSYSMAVFRK